MRVGNLEFLGIFERCERLVRFWFKWQGFLIVLFLFTLPLTSMLPKEGSYHLIAFGCFVGLLFILSIVGFFKIRYIKRDFLETIPIISKHPNKELVSMFKRVPRFLSAIIILELFLIITFPISFLFKYFFHRNLNNILSLIVQ